MKYFDSIVIGAGVSGLSSAQLLKEKGLRVAIIEKDAKPGGLIKCDRIEGHLFHRVGGHVFNTQNNQVSNWFWSHFNREKEFILAKRKAGIQIQSKIVGYPIENYLYTLDNNTAANIINDLLDLETKGTIPHSNNADFQSFLKNRFGATLYHLYFEPYNDKVWKTDLRKVALPWLKDKLPMPNYREIILNNVLQKEEDQMVHSQFFYPRENGSQFIANSLSNELEIFKNTKVNSIVRKNKKWIINDTYCAENVVFTGDVRCLKNDIKNTTHSLARIIESVGYLKSNGTSNLLCSVEDTNHSWLYLPEKDTPAHRIIFTGNFSSSNNSGNGTQSCTVEFSGCVPVSEMKKTLTKLPFKPVYIADNYEPNSYVIQQLGDSEKIQGVKQALEELGFFLVGRFAEWEYYNMDKAIESAMNMASKIHA